MEIIGHIKIRDQFKSLVESKSFPQTSIFYGLNGIGKRLVALEVVSQLFGGVEELEYHSDLFVVGPTPPKSAVTKKGTGDEGRGTKDVQSNWTIKIEQIQELKSKLVHYPLQADYQVVIIDDAEKMTKTTANSLLKTLEEPRANQIFILITSQLNRILPTLRSRSSKFYFSQLSNDDVKKIVLAHADLPEGVDSEIMDFLIDCFRGSPQHILRALEAGINVSFLSRLTKDQRDFRAISQVVKDVLQSHEDLNLILQCLRHYYLRSSDDVSNLDVDFFEKINQAEFQLSRHIQKEFVLENLLL